MERVVTRPITLVYAATLVGLLGLAVLLEMAFTGSLRLPGHRAFPGAFAIILLGEAFAPAILVALAAVASATLVALGFADVPIIAAWSLLALVAGLVYRKELARSLICFVLLGLLFGLLRYAALSFGFHKTPELVRLAGHLGFGAVGGAGAYLAAKATNALGNGNQKGPGNARHEG